MLYETSAATGENVIEMFRDFAQRLTDRSTHGRPALNKINIAPSLLKQPSSITPHLHVFDEENHPSKNDSSGEGSTSRGRALSRFRSENYGRRGSTLRGCARTEKSRSSFTSSKRSLANPSSNVTTVPVSLISHHSTEREPLLSVGGGTEF